MISLEITEIESELSIVRGMSERDENKLLSSNNPLVDKILFSSSEKRRLNLEKRLYKAKAERAHELLDLRLMGTQMTGSISLRSLVKIIEPLNSLLEHSSWRFWDKEGKTEKLDEHFSRLLDLRLAGIESGSTALIIMGNTSPDLTGYSALEEGLRNTFKLLTSSNDEFSDHIHDVGLPACRALSKLMEIMEKQNIAAQFTWSGPEQQYVWDGRPEEITRIKAILADIGEPKVTTEMFKGTVQVLSVRNRIEIYCPDAEQKIIANYHRSLSEEINELHLGELKEFIVEKTVYPLHISQKKRDAYTVKQINSVT